MSCCGPKEGCECHRVIGTPYREQNHIEVDLEVAQLIEARRGVIDEVVIHVVVFMHFAGRRMETVHLGEGLLPVVDYAAKEI